MEKESLKQLLNFIVNVLKENNFGEDEQRVQNLYTSLSTLQEKIPAIDEIDKLKKEINFLEINYDAFNELSYYSNPLFANIKKKIHDEEVKKIREENRRKRGTN